MMYTMQDVTDVSVRPTGKDDKHLPTYDFTRLNAISTCPRDAVVRYGHGKVMSVGTKRALALEAGAASHECYAAARLWQLWKVQCKGDHAMHWGKKLFGEDGFSRMVQAIDDRESERNQYLNFCLEAFYNYGYYDDPEDKRRTVSNIEEALIAYLDRFNLKHDVFVLNDEDPTAFVGIEIPIDVVVTYVIQGDENFTVQFRLIGRADGLHWHGDNLVVHENKTASRLGEAWSMSFETSHQVTGYMIGVSEIVGQEVRDCAVHGMCIPLPKTYDYGGLATENVSRTSHEIMQWFEWALHASQMYQEWTPRPLDAPMYTGACNKYFRACSLIPLCASRSMYEQEQVFESMEDHEWNPLDAEGVSIVKPDSI